MKERVVIVGGGIAGLTAALDLAETNSVTILEAKQRFGGRIHTVRDESGLPFELGAEFVHGTAPETCRSIEAAGLRTHQVPDRHWTTTDGGLLELPDFWEKLSSVTGEIKPGERDRSFEAFLSTIKKPRESKALTRRFIEGFHAAPAEEASIQATRRSEETSEEIDGQKQLRIHVGYGAMVDHIVKCCENHGVALETDARVISIDWKKRPIPVRFEQDGMNEMTADRVIVTLPLGVLQHALDARELLTPFPDGKAEAVRALGIGLVTKVILKFTERFWPEANFGFIHSDDEWFGTWWADERGDLLTAWSGGPASEKLVAKDTHFIVNRALESASKLFGERISVVRELLKGAHTHNWSADPCARGAYSFIPVGAADACGELARSEDDRLFFAGEATDLNYQFGTVHGAIASGQRTAHEIRKLQRRA